jgi:hypothetical protein
MAEGIKETIPKIIKTLWDLENELRGAAQNTVVLRREEAKRHLSDARRHLDALLGLASGSSTNTRDVDLHDERVPPIKH